ncbi:MAG: PhnD/SsuA/transferrin family substrate-binding protein [Hoeflea sp.]|uniref:phosphate/phosphite/phosphonate ABC transporter substrate-binding protein n=1 Tax=Hoeflea sp. TaxID=1940281 RepID=UPI001D4640CC|nr:PhnD/SsuA/transferrin family substrate-binding protein [Hoeflea sp.]MBU4528264.1 PhnD/SsuA/transferrin family substrate-binding protein [Alphaproteobacteria bacterium]MBU4543860.1 PhnD/SsuA/transferrin family substrate-binding protein [Alphaproteobacteria bacterium]MBU4548501.1 PhnD/SsuA/transferrin family substrate-binding protein [Alphaproteobacteria bacterium]MBV1722580.1 PhnD/SsuA/transferrin family substrate-binding protein [Hoeflea sp.]MBV1762249.1 PhnD/SsuA/transferrin family substra
MTGAASLPMYDWPEIRHATDALWAGIRGNLCKRGIAAPAALDRSADPEPLWTEPGLILSQTCGYPYATRLTGKVALVGTPAHAATGASPGHYFSVLIARKRDAPVRLDDLAGLRFAFNMVHSQSGFAAPVRLLAAGGHASLPPPLQTGAHRASIRAVAEGEADWAAIDAVTWELAKRHEPLARDLVVFARTPETPALPLITSLRQTNNGDAISGAVEAAIDELEPDIREAALLTGLVRFKPEDYAPLAAALPVGQVFPGLAS